MIKIIFQFREKQGLTDINIGIINSGGIRGSLPIGDITVEDLYAIQPFQNSVDIITLNGRTLKKLMQKSADTLNLDGTWDGSLFQVSGTLLLRRRVNCEEVHSLLSTKIKRGVRSETFLKHLGNLSSITLMLFFQFQWCAMHSRWCV